MSRLHDKKRAAEIISKITFIIIVIFDRISRLSNFDYSAYGREGSTAC